MAEREINVYVSMYTYVYNYIYYKAILKVTENDVHQENIMVQAKITFYLLQDGSI